VGEIVRPKFGGIGVAVCCERGCDNPATRRLNLVELELGYGVMIEGDKCFKMFCDEHFPEAKIVGQCAGRLANGWRCGAPTTLTFGGYFFCADHLPITTESK
jgi:hypothetical protein